MILACVGTATSCKPFGGAPSNALYEIPADFPAGAIQAGVYFNPNFKQPAGIANGTLTFTYHPR